jgi:hypothetical protein
MTHPRDANYRYSNFEMSAHLWPDDVRLADIEPRFVCKANAARISKAVSL